jgi:Ran-binding protein 1
MNHVVLPATELKANPGSDRAWTWVATDFSDEVAKVESFAIRFRDSEVANDFKTKYDQARKVNGGDKTIVMPVLAAVEEDKDDTPATKKDDDAATSTSAAAATTAATTTETAPAAATTTPASPAK